jgi:hypothetical protein
VLRNTPVHAPCRQNRATSMRAMGGRPFDRTTALPAHVGSEITAAASQPAPAMATMKCDAEREQARTAARAASGDLTQNGLGGRPFPGERATPARVLAAGGDFGAA